MGCLYLCSYIEQYGFYEGGDANDYRIDPILLAAFLRGRADESAVVVMRRRGLAALVPLEKALHALEEQRATIKAIDLPALDAAISRARTEVEQQRAVLTEKLAKMHSTI